MVPFIIAQFQEPVTHLVILNGQTIQYLMFYVHAKLPKDDPLVKRQSYGINVEWQTRLA